MMDSVVGIDVGGSHLCSAWVDLQSYTLIPGTKHTVQVNNKAAKDEILRNWSEAINRTLQSFEAIPPLRLGFAMPGPFRYKTGRAMFVRNDKYEQLYDVSIPEELGIYLPSMELEYRFLNDATAFAVGASVMGEARHYKRIIAITLGTGFGSAFLLNGVPLVVAEDVPEEGCLWNKPYLAGIADDYFSTRWFISQYQQLTGRSMSGVKAIAETDDAISRQLFEKFGNHLAEFMIPFVRKFQPEAIILGGNISQSQALFMPPFQQALAKAGMEVQFIFSELMEEAAIIGSARLFNESFWEQIKDKLPDL